MENCSLRKRQHSNAGETSQEDNKKFKKDSLNNKDIVQNQEELDDSNSTLAVDDVVSDSELVSDVNTESASNCDAKKKLEEVDKVIDSELECGVCKELLIDSCVLPCGHIFCGYCIRMWLFNSETCPVCRSYTDFIISTRGLDHFLDILVKLVKPELVESRAKMTNERRTIIQRAEATWMAQQHVQSVPHQTDGPTAATWQDWITQNPIDLTLENIASPQASTMSNLIIPNQTQVQGNVPNGPEATLSGPGMNLPSIFHSMPPPPPLPLPHGHHNFRSIPVLVTFPTDSSWFNRVVTGGNHNSIDANNNNVLNEMLSSSNTSREDLSFVSSSEDSSLSSSSSTTRSTDYNSSSNSSASTLEEMFLSSSSINQDTSYNNSTEYDGSSNSSTRSIDYDISTNSTTRYEIDLDVSFENNLIDPESTLPMVEENV